MPGKKIESPRRIQSLDRAVQLLDRLAEKPEGVSLKELAGTMNLKPQTVQSLLRTLEYHELVIQASRGAPYMLGARAHQWSRLWLSKMDLASAVQPIIAHLANELGEYVLLARLQGHVLVRLLEQSVNRTLAVNLHDDRSRPLYTMATGQVLLASLQEPQLTTVLETMERPSRGSAAINIASLRKKLQTIRQQGYAEIASNHSGIAAAAVPVDAPPDKGPLALGVALPTVRYKGIDQVLPALRRSGKDIAARLQANRLKPPEATRP